MNIFNRYADFYDAWYISKDYRKEASFVLSLAKKYTKKNIKTILDMGCGTGGHLIPFAKAGLETVGFDLSETMVKLAKEKLAKMKNKALKTITSIQDVTVGV